MNAADFLASITLAIIAGGRGARMGIRKHHLRLDDRPILQHLLERCRWPGPTLLILGFAHDVVPGANLVNHVVSDALPDQGPLRGLLTALDHARTQALIAIPIDMPHLRSEHLHWLAHRAMRTSPAALMLRRVHNPAPQIEPFPAYYTLAMRPLVQARLAAGRRSLHALAEESAVQLIDAPPEWDPATWTNLNTPRDLDDFARTLRITAHHAAVDSRPEVE